MYLSRLCGFLFILFTKKYSRHIGLDKITGELCGRVIRHRQGVVRFVCVIHLDEIITAQKESHEICHAAMKRGDNATALVYKFLREVNLRSS
jgi:hypothetical protein